MASRWNWKPTPSSTPSAVSVSVEEPPPSTKSRKKSKTDKLGISKREYSKHERFHSSKPQSDRPSSEFTKMVLDATPENTYNRPKWSSPEILDILQVHLEDYSKVEDRAYPGLSLLEDVFPEVYNILVGDLHAQPPPKVPAVWKTCIDALKHSVQLRYDNDTDSVVDLCSTLDSKEQYYGDSSSKKKTLATSRSLVGINRPLTVAFLQAICSQFIDCVGFEALGWAWKVEKYAFRQIRVGPQNGERLRVELREDICWKARKQEIPGAPVQKWPIKKLGMGPLFAVLIKTPAEYTDLRLSALADLKVLLTLLQDRRREASYTTSDNISSREQLYTSYIVSISTSMVATVSINTLTASGYYLSAIENGEPPPKGEILIYRRGQNLQLGEVEGRVEFARIMLGLLGKVCTRKETPDQEPEEDTPEEKPIQVKSENGSTWEKVMKKSRFSISLRSSTSSPRGRDAGDKNVPAAPIAPLEVSSEA